MPITFAPNVEVCEYVTFQFPVKRLIDENDELSQRYTEPLSCLCSDANPCYRLSLMIKAWFNAPYEDICSGHWFAGEEAQKHLGRIIYQDEDALFGEYDQNYLEYSLKILARALGSKIERMDRTEMKTLFWNPDVAIKTMGQKTKLYRFHDQFLDYKMDMNDVHERKKRDDERKKEIEEIEREIALYSNIIHKQVEPPKPQLYRHPTSINWCKSVEVA